jgi:hypothetical protein
MTTIAKAVAALLGAAGVTLVSALSDGHVNTVEAIQIAIAVATAAGVYLAANVPQMVWAKTAIATVLAVLNLYVTYVAAGPITTAEWVNLGIAALTALGVYVVPNGSRAAVPRA